MPLVQDIRELTLSTLANGAAEEMWAPVPGFDGRYVISTMGRVLGPGRGGDNRGGWDNKLPRRALTSHVSRCGYLVVALRLPGGRRYGRLVWRSVHRLVLETFVGPCPPGMEAAHLDGNRVNPDLRNMKWVTPRENASHRVLHGTLAVGNRNGRTKLSVVDLQDIVCFTATGRSSYDLSQRYGVTPQTINRVRAGTARRG